MSTTIESNGFAINSLSGSALGYDTISGGVAYFPGWLAGVVLHPSWMLIHNSLKDMLPAASSVALLLVNPEWIVKNEQRRGVNVGD